MKAYEIVLLILATLLVVGAAVIFLLRRSKKTTPPTPPAPRPAPPQPSSMDALVSTYCELLQQTEQQKSLDVYRDLFNRTAPLYQTLLGLARRMKAEGETQAWLLENAALAFDHMHPSIRLNATGFQVDVPAIRQVDTPALRARCQATSAADLTAEINRMRAALRPARLSFQAIIEQTGPILFQLREAAQIGSPAEELIASLNRVLEQNGCLPRYFDDPIIRNAESLRAQFIVESPFATETPGLYIREGDRLHLIGMCAGTVRGDEA